MQITFIDHHDSFSWNVISWLGRIPNCEVLRFEYDQFLMEKPIPRDCPLVISPGPGSPANYGLTRDLIDRSLDRVPILGICLGHQLLGEALGFETVASNQTWHGRKRNIAVTSKRGIFQYCPGEINMATYNSLKLIGEGDVKNNLFVSARSGEEGEIEAIERWQNPKAPAIGLQFHPESFLSDRGESILKAWSEFICPYQLMS